ncbi:MAG: Slp family lipoprotein [Chromatiales bacterium]|jgi:outer membrane lipoprotein
MHPAIRAASKILICALLAGCAGAPAYTPHPAARWIVPQEVGPETKDRLRPVEWGGTIVDVRNLPHSTEIEVLAYPLDADGRPDTERRPQGRFIAVERGFLEPAEYAPGRELTAHGPLTGVRQGAIGETTYRYPTLGADSLFLWPRKREGRGPDVRFGVGIGIGL